MNANLIDPEALRQSQERYFREHPTPQMILIAHAKAHPELTAKQLGVFVGYGERWVRKVLRDANIALPGARGRVKISAATPCKACGHAKGGPAAMNARQPSHCEGGWIHIAGRWPNQVRHICEGPHCIEGCPCPGFVKP
jgi:hypothetical protein